MIICYEDVEDDRFPVRAGKGYVRASSGTFWKFERLPEVRGIPQTRVTLRHCTTRGKAGSGPRGVLEKLTARCILTW
ncbi:hypothetical protein TrST_g6002 [Triparma strigata]|uniref:Uncharacterized protein n=1 Tax=Triparma strigata TaxID=1606541 RepID=A0A9W7BBM2_9STRA|nr:hypothetical protein TrST_g6002 [Triparma strigata]